MKVKLVRLITTLLLAFCVYSLMGQQLASDTDDSKATVNGALVELQSGLYTGLADKNLARLGDEAADATIRTHSLQEMSVRPMSIAIARLISASFASPTLIRKESNKIPKMSILLLIYLRSTAKTSEEIEAVSLADEVVKRQLKTQVSTN